VKINFNCSRSDQIAFNQKRCKLNLILPETKIVSSESLDLNWFGNYVYISLVGQSGGVVEIKSGSSR